MVKTRPRIERWPSSVVFTALPCPLPPAIHAVAWWVPHRTVSRVVGGSDPAHGAALFSFRRFAASSESRLPILVPPTGSAPNPAGQHTRFTPGSYERKTTTRSPFSSSSRLPATCPRSPTGLHVLVSSSTLEDEIKTARRRCAVFRFHTGSAASANANLRKKIY